MSDRVFTTRMKVLEALERDVISAITPTNTEAAKKEFLANPELEHPNFEYGRLEDYSEERRILRDLGFLQVNSNPELRKIVMQQTLDLEQQLLIAGEMRSYQETGILLKPTLKYWIQKTWGKPKMETFRSLLAMALAGIRQKDLVPEDFELLEKLREEFGMTWEEVETLVGENGGETEAKVDPELLAKFRRLLGMHWSEILTKFPLNARDERNFTAEEVRDILTEIIQEHLPEAREFRAVVTPERTGINCDQEKKLIELPLTRAKGPYTQEVIKATLIGHELMTHVMRRCRVEEKYPELATRLAGYLEFEEGLATAVEHALKWDAKISGTDHYLVIGMAVLLGMNFRETFEACRDLSFLRKVKREDDAVTRALKMQRAENDAFRRVTRCFRGTGIVPLTKDLVYYNGQRKVWSYIESLIDKDPEKLWRNLFERGKTDPTNPLHRKVIKAVGLEI